MGICYSHTELEGVCLCPEGSRLDSHVVALRARHVLRLALHQRPKLLHSIIIPVRPLRARSDNSSEAASCNPSSFNASRQDSCWICARIVCERQSGCVKKQKQIITDVTQIALILLGIKLYLNSASFPKLFQKGPFFRDCI